MENITLESYFVKDGKSYKKFKALAEEEKKLVNKELINSLFKSVKTKSLKVNYMGLEKTKGDITQFSKYDDIVNCIKILENMYKSNPNDAPKEINTLVRSLAMLKKYAPEFKKAFSDKNELAILTYTNMSAALISSTAMLISATMEFLKQPEGNYKAIFSDKKAVEKDVYIASLDRFLNMDIKGEFKRLFNAKLSESGLTEDCEQSDLLSEDLGLGLIILASIFIAVFAIRDIVFMFYFTGAKISESLLTLAYFLEQHALGIDATTTKGKDIRDRQFKVVEKLRTIAVKIKGDNKTAEKKSEREKEKEDEENSEIPDNTVLL